MDCKVCNANTVDSTSQLIWERITGGRCVECAKWRWIFWRCGQQLYLYFSVSLYFHLYSSVYLYLNLQNVQSADSAMDFLEVWTAGALGRWMMSTRTFPGAKSGTTFCICLFSVFQCVFVFLSVFITLEEDDTIFFENPSQVAFFRNSI